MARTKRAALVAGLATLALLPGAAAQAVAAPPAQDIRLLAAPSAQDAQFLQAAHQANLAEIAKGNLTQQKNASQQVKDLGSRMIQDHTRLDQSLQQTASKLNVTLPGSPTSDQQASLTQLQGVNAEAFDRMFVSTNLAWHERTMQLIDTELSQGSDPAAKRVAQDAAPVIRAHHDALQALARSIGVPSPGGSSGSPGIGGHGAGTPSPGGASTGPETSEEPQPGPS